METIILNSCSKINVGLNILRKRPDGFHDIETVFYPVRLCDTISFRKSDEFRFICENDLLKNNPDNLIIKAKNKIEELAGVKIKAEILLAKYIPIGGGLGGGSSNAANTLKGLNLLFNLNLKDADLRRAALELGSDVPFFFENVPCLGTGRGEILEVVDFHIKYPILIINPQIHISTRWAFENITPASKPRSLKDILKDNPGVENFRDNFTNDFEEIVFSNHTEIRAIKETMYSSGAFFSLMSGSGSTVYGIFKSYKNAREVQLSFKKYTSFIHYENI